MAELIQGVIHENRKQFVSSDGKHVGEVIFRHGRYGFNANRNVQVILKGGVKGWARYSNPKDVLLKLYSRNTQERHIR